MALEMIEIIPGRRRNPGPGRIPYAAREIDEFLADKSGMKYAKVTIEGKEPKNMAQSFRLFLRKNPDVAEQVAVHFVGGELYLERLDVEE